jgi:hypothetical protein
MRRYKDRSNLRLTQTLTSSYKLSSNTSHSGVGCYAPVARTTLNPGVLFAFFQLTSKTLRPLLILGFRAGALCHPFGDLLSDTPPLGALSDQVVETIQHILICCVFPSKCGFPFFRPWVWLPLRLRLRTLCSLSGGHGRSRECRRRLEKDSIR